MLAKEPDVPGRLGGDEPTRRVLRDRACDRLGPQSSLDADGTSPQPIGVFARRQPFREVRESTAVLEAVSGGPDSLGDVPRVTPVAREPPVVKIQPERRDDAGEEQERSPETALPVHR